MNVGNLSDNIMMVTVCNSGEPDCLILNSKSQGFPVFAKRRSSKAFSCLTNQSSLPILLCALVDYRSLVP